MTLMVSIGRNVDGEPMGSRRWERFREDTVSELGRVYGDAAFVFVGRGSGIYGEEREDSATFVLAGDHVRPHDALDVNLTALARKYGQDSIAVTFGSTRFVGSADEEG